MEVDKSVPSRRQQKSAAAFRTISEVATELGVPQHVLRFWETKFRQVKPMKRGGGRRYYRPEDLVLLKLLRGLLYDDAYTIRGVQKLLKEKGVKALINNNITDVERSPQLAAAQSEASINPVQVKLMLAELKDMQRTLAEALPK